MRVLDVDKQNNIGWKVNRPNLSFLVYCAIYSEINVLFILFPLGILNRLRGLYQITFSHVYLMQSTCN